MNSLAICSDTKAAFASSNLQIGVKWLYFSQPSILKG